MDESGWKDQLRLHEAKVRELQKKGPPIKAAIRSFVAERAGADLGAELRIAFSIDMTHIGFDIWYQTDEALERDKSSGRQEELAEIMRTAARECAHADSEVRFHSHQFVREKCGGDYFLYMR
jgi:hypothetical protein